MSSDYVRVTFIGLRAPGDIETLLCGRRLLVRPGGRRYPDVETRTALMQGPRADFRSGGGTLRAHMRATPRVAPPAPRRPSPRAQRYDTSRQTDRAGLMSS